MSDTEIDIGSRSPTRAGMTKTARKKENKQFGALADDLDRLWAVSNTAAAQEQVKGEDMSLDPGNQQVSQPKNRRTRQNHQKLTARQARRLAEARKEKHDQWQSNSIAAKKAAAERRGMTMEEYESMKKDSKTWRKRERSRRKTEKRKQEEKEKNDGDVEMAL